VLALVRIDQQIGPGIRPHEQLPAGHEDVAPAAEVVVVHHVVVGLEAGTDRDQKQCYSGAPQRHQNAAMPGRHPVADPAFAPPQNGDNRERHDGAQHDTADHQPAGLLEDPLDHGNQRIRQRRSDYD
jgi:hypothetical protein